MIKSEAGECKTKTNGDRRICYVAEWPTLVSLAFDFGYLGDLTSFKAQLIDVYFPTPAMIV